MKSKLLKLFAIAACVMTAAIASISTDSLTVHAAETVYTLGENVIGTLSEDGTTLTISGNGAMTRTLSNAGVSKTGPTTLIIEEGITSICDKAFDGYSNFIGNLVISSSVRYIGNYAFNACKFTGNLNIPSSVKTISDYAFSNCTGFTGDLIIPDNVTSLGRGAFYNCTGFNGTLTIGSGITKIIDYTPGSYGVERGKGVFEGCTGLTGDINIPDTITSIGNGAFYGCTGFNGNLNLGNGVTNIGNGAFYKCTGLTGDLTIPNNVTTIGSDAFRECKGFNGNLTLSTNLTSLGSYAFYNCSKLTGNLVIPSGLTSINQHTFYYCTGLNGTLTIPDSITSIGDYAFYYCTGFSKLVLGSGLTIISQFTFCGCTGLTGTLVIPDNITKINNYAFKNLTGVNKIQIGTGVTKLKPGAFALSSNIDTTIITDNAYAKSYNWSGDKRTATVKGFNERPMTLTGTVSAINTLDITIPITGLSFVIDENRDFIGQTSIIKNNQSFPLEVYILDINKNTTEPDVVAENTFSEYEWNNLSMEQTLSNIALKINGIELYPVYGNTAKDENLAIKLGQLKSGYDTEQTLELVPGAQYGKNFGHSEIINLQYNIVFEFRIP